MNDTGLEADRLRRGFRIGEWLVEPQTDRVALRGVETHVRPRVMDVLVFLASRPSQVVRKEEILDAVWETRNVAESALTSVVAELRRALRDDPRRPWLLETIPKRGYRLLARSRPFSPPSCDEGPATSGAAPWPEGPGAVFVGRNAELARLESAFREARSGRGRAVFVAGESGSGKTALMAEFARRILAAEPDASVAGGRCHLRPGPVEPCLPFREALRVLSGEPEAGWLPVAGSSVVARAVSEWKPVFAQAVEANGRLLQGTLLPGPARRHPHVAAALFGQVEATLRAFSATRPLVLLVDDLQWADASSLSLLFYLARHLPRSRILVVAAYRPEDLGSAASRHPLEKVVDELVRYGGDAIVRLGEEADREFLDALVDAVPNRLDEAFRAALFRLTEGQPLLTIELLRTLRARGALVPDGGGQWVVRGSIPWEALPTRVEAIVRERVESLDPPSRAVLDMAAVEGEEACAEVLATALDEPVAHVVEVLSGVLGRQRHLLTASRTRAVGGRRFGLYRFRHALFQRYLYERLDAVERALRHDRLAEAVTRLFEVPTPERDAAIATHLENGGRPARAAPYRLALADRASLLGAPDEALANYTAALSLLEGEEQTAETSALRRRAEAGRSVAAGLVHGHSSSQSGDALHTLRDLCRAAGDEAGLVRATFQLVGHHGARGESVQAAAFAREAAVLAQRRGVAVEISRSLDFLGIVETVTGELETAVDAFTRAERLREEDPAGEAPEPCGEIDPSVAAGCWWTQALLFLGLPDQAAARASGTIELARKSGNPFAVDLASGLGLGLFLVLGQRGAEALETAREVVERAERHGNPTLLALGEFLLGAALAEIGCPEGGESHVRRALAMMSSMDHVSGRALMLGKLSQILAARGRARESQCTAAEAVATARSAGELNYLPELMRIHAESAAAGAGPRGSGEMLEAALECARDRRALLFELRCAVSLHRLHGAGARTEAAARARDLVRELRSRFVEGLGSPDVLRADRLLVEWAAAPG